MKKLILTFGIFLAGIVFVNAQDAAANKTTKVLNHITEVCGLTPDQVSKVQPVVADYVKTRMANKAQYASDAKRLKAANQAAGRNYQTQLKATLTPDQFQKLKEARAQHQANKQGGQTQQEQQ